jgi:hypothetical protein
MKTEQYQVLLAKLAEDRFNGWSVRPPEGG